ncbi:uncharacterized protein LOC135496602 isoform X2 [Lineus longissimus]|uniref:uncharacterized protein LOC135496602 isoform X2 n=1 Tax=Lineus longissimus TaxID=88925 RepID=UPI002B4C2C27
MAEDFGTVLKMYSQEKDCRAELPAANGNILSSLLHKGKLQHGGHHDLCDSPYQTAPIQSRVPSHLYNALHGKVPSGIHSARASPDGPPLLRPDYRPPPQLIQMTGHFRTPVSLSHTISSPLGHSEDIKPVKHVLDNDRERKFIRHHTHHHHQVDTDLANQRYLEQVRLARAQQVQQAQQQTQVYEAGSYQRSSPGRLEAPRVEATREEPLAHVERREHRDSVESMDTQSFPLSLTTTREALTPDKTDTDSGVYTDSEQDEPMDLSCRRNSTPISVSGSSSPPTPEPVQNGSHGCFNIAIADTQYLRELLSRTGGQESPRAQKEQSQGNTAHYTKVTLAKKNLLPVSARVSDWLMKIVQFSESIPEFKNLTQNDKVTLLLSSWSRVLLLYMAENNFHFVVSPDNKDGSADSQTPPPPSVPTVKSVEMVLSLIRKYQTLNLDAKEYLMLRIAVLFQCDAGFLEKPEIVDSVRQQVQECLQQHVQVTRPDDVMRYAKLLMSLPVLYSIDDKMMENLFCKHITGDTDVTVLLKEMLKSV